LSALYILTFSKSLQVLYLCSRSDPGILPSLKANIEIKKQAYFPKPSADYFCQYLSKDELDI
jgi:hypothetical protein